MMERLFIAEKASQAEAIASFMEVEFRAARVQRHGAIEVGPDVISWTNGHVFEDAPPEAYDPALSSWDRATLPFFPTHWKRVPRKGGEATIAILRSLIALAKNVVNACDFDREGQLIFDEVVEELGISVPVLRLPIDAYDDVSMREAFALIKPNSEYRTMSLAARKRSQADYAQGINLTRIYSLAAQEAGYITEKSSVRIGRVISPTHHLILQRDSEIANFVPVTYYKVGAICEGAHGEMYVQWVPPDSGPGIDVDGLVVDKTLAEGINERIKAAGHAEILSVDDDTSEAVAPLPYSLSSLQAALIDKHRLTAKEIYDAAQRLYSFHKLISYFRANNRFYKSSHHARAPQVTDAIAKNLPEMESLISELDLSHVSRAWDDKKVGAHHGIAPTQNVVPLTALNEKEQIVYSAIVRAYLMQFFGPKVTVSRKITVKFDKDIIAVMTPAHSTITDLGWERVRRADLPEKADAPKYEVGDRIFIQDCGVLEQKTQPPKPFTEGKLIAALNDVGQFVSDPVLKKVLGPKASLGSEATQTETIEKLLISNYVTRGKNPRDDTDGAIYLVPTPLCGAIGDELPEEYRGPYLTAVNEKALHAIEAGSLDPEVWLANQLDLTRDMCAYALKVTLPVKPAGWDPKSARPRSKARSAPTRTPT